MANDVDLFGRSVAIGPPPRYQPGTRVDQRPWNAADELLMWPVILACQSEQAYNAACMFLCEQLNRVPRPKDQRPTREVIIKESVHLIEMRTLGRHLQGWPPVMSLAQELFVEHRRATAPTWGELLYLWKWGRNLHGAPRIQHADLMVFLERPAADDVLIQTQARYYTDRDRFDCSQFTAFGNPARRANVGPLRAAIEAFRNTPDPMTWAELHHVARN